MVGFKKTLKDILTIAGVLPRKPSDRDYHKHILSPEEGNDFIKNILISGKPALVTRLGHTELKCLSFYHKNIRKKVRVYPQWLREEMANNPGVFSPTDSVLDRFAKLYLNVMPGIDALGVWFNNYENVVAKEYCPRAELIPLRSIEPYYYEKPWSVVLKGKTVLVVHPFEETVKAQYVNRKDIFKDADVLPGFELKTFKTVQSLAGMKTGFLSWFDALDHMCLEIQKIDFDIAIIGAGAYGLPLAAFIKKMGKMAVHMGGATQILFGIKGGRWDQHEIISSLYNEHWVRPSGKEIPPGFKKVEGGSYW